MGSFSIWHWLIVLAVVLLLFGGRGKISQLMGDFGKGLNAFKRGMREDGNKDEAAAGEPRKLEADHPGPTATVSPAASAAPSSVHPTDPATRS